MAAGTVVSRMSGFVRSALLVAALGASAARRPVQHRQHDPEHALHPAGRRRLQRRARAPAGAGDEERPRRRRGLHQPVITLADLFLGAGHGPAGGRRAVGDAALPRRRATARAELAAQRESVIDFARFCLPQVFFYGMFVLVGQILNSRGRFGPMMWAPIANNVISVGVLVVYLFVFGPAAERRAGRRASPPARRLLLGLGSTARHRGAVPDPAALPARGRLPLPAPLRLPRHRARPHPAARRLDRAVRDRQPDRLHGRGPARLERYRGTRRRRRADGTGYTIYSSPS